MKIEVDRFPSFAGFDPWLPDKYVLRFNKQERRTLGRAWAIIEEAREKISDAMGSEAFQYSPLFTLDLMDVMENDPAWIEERL